MKPTKIMFGLAAIANIVSVFLPWWSDFETYTRIQKDILLVGFLTYKVDPPPNSWQLPSHGSQMIFSTWPLQYELLLAISIGLLLIGATIFVKAMLNPEIERYLGLEGLICSISATVLFAFILQFINTPLGYLGSISQGVESWGPDAGFFVVLYSISLASVGYALSYISKS